MSSSSAVFTLPEANIKEPTQLFDRVIIALNAYLSAHKKDLIAGKQKRDENIKSIARIIYRYFGIVEKSIDEIINKVLNEANLKLEIPEIFPLPSRMAEMVEPEPRFAVSAFEKACADIETVFKTQYITGFTLYGYNPLPTGSSTFKESVEAALKDKDNVIQWLKKEAEKERAYLFLYCQEVAIDAEGNVVQPRKISQTDFDALLLNLADCIKQISLNGYKTFYINDISYIGKFGKSYPDVMEFMKGNQFEDVNRYAFGVSLNLSSKTINDLTLHEKSASIKNNKILKSVSEIEIWNMENPDPSIESGKPVVKQVIYDNEKLVENKVNDAPIPTPTPSQSFKL